MAEKTAVTIRDYIDTHIPGLRDLFLDDQQALSELQDEGLEIAQRFNIEVPPTKTDIPLPIPVWDQVFSGL